MTYFFYFILLIKRLITFHRLTKMMKPTFHVLILDGRVAAVRGFLHIQKWHCWANKNKNTHRHTQNSQIFNTTVWTVTMCFCQKYRTHTAACVTQRHTGRICKTEPPPCRGWWGEGGADCTVRVNGVGEGHPPELHPSEHRGAAWDQGTAPAPHTFSCNRRHTDKNDRQTAISPTTQASATRSTTHKKTTSGRGGRVYLDSIYRVMDDSSLRLLEEEWRERMKEKRGCGVAKWERRDKWEFLKTVGSTEEFL